MGISTNFYTIYGLYLEEDHKDFNSLYEYYDENYDEISKNINFIFDGMSGKYIVIGEVLFDSGDARYGFEDGDALALISVGGLSLVEESYKQNFRKYFPEKFHYILDSEFKIITFSHYA